LTQDTTNTGLWQVRELGDVHVPLKTMPQDWNSGVQKTMWGCVLAHLSRYITPNCISMDQLTLNWKSGAHKQKYMLRCHCGTDIFQERFLDKVMGMKGGVWIL